MLRYATQRCESELNAVRNMPYFYDSTKNADRTTLRDVARQNIVTSEFPAYAVVQTVILIFNKL